MTKMCNAHELNNDSSVKFDEYNAVSSLIERLKKVKQLKLAVKIERFNSLTNGQKLHVANQLRIFSDFNEYVEFMAGRIAAHELKKKGIINEVQALFDKCAPILKACFLAIDIISRLDTPLFSAFEEGGVI